MGKSWHRVFKQNETNEIQVLSDQIVELCLQRGEYEGSIADFKNKSF